VELRDKVDHFAERITAAYPNQVNCRRGCRGCCETDLTVFPVEAEPIEAALTTLPPETLARVRQRRLRQEHCVFLVEDECVVYAQRPLICRTQGILLQVDRGARTACPLNFAGEGEVEALPVTDVLNLNTLNLMLSVLHRLHIGQTAQEDRRVRLADLT